MPVDISEIPCSFGPYSEGEYRRYAAKELREAYESKKSTWLHSVYNLVLLSLAVKFFWMDPTTKYDVDYKQMMSIYHDNDLVTNKLEVPQTHLWVIAFFVFAICYFSCKFFLELKNLEKRANERVKLMRPGEKNLTNQTNVYGGNVVFDNHGYMQLSNLSGQARNNSVGSMLDARESAIDFLKTLNNVVLSHKYDDQKKEAEAKEILDLFNEEANGKCRPGIIKTAWNGLVSLVPDIANIANAAAELSKLFT